jgi:hypothetical protein
VRTATLWLTALSILLGFISAYAALHNAGDVLVYVLLLMFGGLLGYIGPEAPWRWALILGMWVPIAEIVSRVSEPPLPPVSALLAPIAAIIPALAGVYGGALVHRFLPRHEEEA